MLNKNSKAQIGQIFVYILAIIVFSLVLLFGYKSIKDLTSKSEKVSYIHFKTKLESTIKRVDYGDVLIEEFSLPGSYSKVCVIDLNQGPDTTGNVIVDNSWEDNVNANIFLISSPDEVESFYIEKEKISVIGESDQNFVCFTQSQGNVKIRFEGKGRYAEISSGS